MHRLPCLDKSSQNVRKDFNRAPSQEAVSIDIDVIRAWIGPVIANGVEYLGHPDRIAGSHRPYTTRAGRPGFQAKQQAVNVHTPHRAAGNPYAAVASYAQLVMHLVLCGCDHLPDGVVGQ